MDGPRAKMHHKFTVVDRRIVLTGSYNYTTSATEANRENLVRIESYRVAGDYLAEFERLR
jgi:phosphatidylserine/phosphatidylglycerophosphate/cardiolipin synthase-like enzyme